MKIECTPQELKELIENKKETLELINKKIRELIQDEATSMVMALDLIEAINKSNNLSKKQFIDKLIDEALEKSNTSKF